MKHQFFIHFALLSITFLLSNTVIASDLNPDASIDQEPISLSNDPDIDRNIQENDLPPENESRSIERIS